MEGKNKLQGGERNQSIMAPKWQGVYIKYNPPPIQQTIPFRAGK